MNPISVIPADRDEINEKMSRMSIENVYNSPMLNMQLPFQCDNGRKTEYKSSINDRFHNFPQQQTQTDNRLFDTMNSMERFSQTSRINNYREINNNRLNNMNLMPCTTAIPLIKPNTKDFYSLLPVDTRQNTLN